MSSVKPRVGDLRPLFPPEDLLSEGRVLLWSTHGQCHVRHPAGVLALVLEVKRSRLPADGPSYIATVLIRGDMYRVPAHWLK